MKNLEKKLAEIKISTGGYQAKDIDPLVDLTLLKSNATATEIKEIYNTATHKGMAAICLFPQNYASLHEKININKATVVNFPSGNATVNQVIADIDYAINTYSIDEIDYVFPYAEYLQHSKKIALQHCKESYKICLKYNKKLKVIIETGALPSLDCIYTLSREIIDIGCDFIKTSTGKIDKGASIDAAFAISSAIKDSQSNCGIKVSGGIRTYQSAEEYIKLCEYVLDKKANASWMRIGSSGLSVNV